jgi:hypothetical protein
MPEGSMQEGSGGRDTVSGRQGSKCCTSFSQTVLDLHVGSHTAWNLESTWDFAAGAGVCVQLYRVSHHSGTLDEDTAWRSRRA